LRERLLALHRLEGPIVNRRPLFEQFGRMLTAVGNTPTMVTGEGARQQKWPLRRVRRPTHFAFIADTPYHRGCGGSHCRAQYPPSSYGVG
jgi:hypothetical protein